MLYMSPLTGVRRDKPLEEKSLDVSREIQIERRSNMMNTMVQALVMASVLGTLWAWIVWIVVGGLAGALADRLIQGDKLGIFGNIVIGIVGGLLGGVLLGFFGFVGNGIIWTFVTAFLGAALLLWIINAITGGRGIGKRARR